MCGILGVSRMTDVTRKMLGYLAWEMESRGRDSWGGTDGVDMVKHLGPVTKSWNEAVDTIATWPRGIFHTRAASTGAISIPNQHPFVAERDGRVVVGIHNGIVSNHEHLNKKYNRDFDCDSPHVFMAIVGHSPTSEIYGYGNLAWYEMTPEAPEPLLHLLRFNGDNLNVVQLETGEVVFCSLLDPIRRAAHMAGSSVKHAITTEGDTLYTVHATDEDPSKDYLYKIRSMPFGTRGMVTQHALALTGGETKYGHVGHRTYDWRSHGGGGSTYVPVTIDTLNASDRTNNICANRTCTNKVPGNRRKALFCKDCYELLETEVAEILVN